MNNKRVSHTHANCAGIHNTHNGVLPQQTVNENNINKKKKKSTTEQEWINIQKEWALALYDYSIHLLLYYGFHTILIIQNANYI